MGIPLPKLCGLYLPGHEVHWIQGLHSSRAGEVPPVPCRILEVDDDGVVVVELNSHPLRLWTHDPVRLQAIVAEHGPEALYQERWRLLRVPHLAETSGLAAHYCIDVTQASDPERRPCPASPPRYSTLLEQLRETGGFSMTGADFVAAGERMARGD